MGRAVFDMRSCGISLGIFPPAVKAHLLREYFAPKKFAFAIVQCSDELFIMRDDRTEKKPRCNAKDESRQPNLEGVILHKKASSARPQCYYGKWAQG